jgi:antitoxin HicB
LLGAAQTKVDRLVDFEHSSKIEQVEAALAALGKRLKVSAEAA